MRELPFDRGLGQVLRDDSRFEGAIRLRIFERLEDGFGREAVAQGVPPGSVFSVLAARTGAFQRIAAVRLDLLERRHARGTVSTGPARFCARRRAPGFAGAATSTPGPVGLGSGIAGDAGKRVERVSFQSFSAVPSASMPRFDHQSASLPARWSSRWCNRHSGTVYSSLTLRPSARTWANRR